MRIEKKRGGARLGAGRKAIAPGEKRVQMVITVDPKTKETLDHLRRFRALRPGQVVDYLLDRHYDDI